MAMIAPFMVERWFAEYEFRVSLNIAESCIKPLTPREICDISGMDLDSLVGGSPIGYVDSAGSPELRETIATMYPNTDASQVLVTTGAIEANYLLHSALVHDGDTVICQWPAYQQLYEVARARGARLLLWHLSREHGFRPDLGELRQLAAQGARLIVINNPHNPTGIVLDAEEMRQVHSVARQAGAILNIDEVYHGIFYGEPQPTARALGPDVVVTSSLSKAYGLPGARIGWVTGPREIVDACSVIRDYTSICPAQLGERLAKIVLEQRDVFLQRSMTLARQNLATVRQWMSQMYPLVQWVEPQAGVVAFPWYDLAVDSETVCRRLADQYDALVVPGCCFGHDHHFRLGFGYDPAKLSQGLGRLGKLLAKL